MYQKTVSEVKERVDYETLIHTHDIELVDNIVNVMVDVMLLGNDYYKIEGISVPAELVKERYRQLAYGSIETLLLGLNDIYYKISNQKAYLITALYNAPLTAGAAMSNRIKSDMYGKGVE